MSKRPATLVLRAPAKVNLYLRVRAKDNTGYHPLETVFQEISLHDTLRMTRTRGPIRFLSRSSKVPVGKDNLIVKALTRLRKTLRVPYGMRVTLAKRIPTGAGLGGGSSDAAAALKGGWLLWKGPFPADGIPRPLFHLARGLGADVPFFLAGGKAWAEGIGDRLSPLPPGEPRWLVVVYPGFSISTAEAYRMLDQARKKGGRLAKAIEPSPNSFEPVVFAHYPILARLKKRLARAGCDPVLLSGSGSSLFGFAKGRIHAERVRRKLQKPPWRAFAAQTW